MRRSHHIALIVAAAIVAVVAFMAFVVWQAMVAIETLLVALITALIMIGG